MIVCFIQSRLGSSRLPNKALLPLLWGKDEEQPLITHVISRCRDIAEKVPIFCLIPYGQIEIYEDATVYHKINYLMGDERNVYSRFVSALDLIEDTYGKKIQTCIRITGDCPLICPDIIDRVLQHHKKNAKMGVFYTSNDTDRSAYPDGQDVEIFEVDAFRKYLPMNYEEREHVTIALKRSSVCGLVMSDLLWPKEKLSVDTEEDYQTVKTIFDSLGGDVPRTAKELCSALWKIKYV